MRNSEMVGSIRNFVQLTKNIGTSGQPTAAQFEIIAGQGYDVVINLATPDHVDSIPNEGEIVTSLGMMYVHLPVPFDNPKIAHVRRFCGLMDVLNESKTWVHCIMNYRVSAFMYLYLKNVVGLSDVESRSPMLSQWNPDETWIKVLNWSAKELEK